MYLDLFHYVFLVFYFNLGQVSIVDQTLIYQKDMSEHCRRRVLPSVFLGRRVSHANAQVLHFSRLALPYSCFISIRSQLGSNIILVIQVGSQDNLLESCSRHANQLKVYELGETFGGYWGPLPDSVLQPNPTVHKQLYTLKTTVSINAEPLYLTRKKTTNIVNETTTPYVTEVSKQQYLRYEVPLMNMTARFEPGKPQPTTPFNMERIFDEIYDVKPRPYHRYDSSVIPLLQFSLSPHKTTSFLRSENKYQIDYEDTRFTPDSKLSILDISRNTNVTMIKGRPFRKMSRNRNIFLKFKKNKTTYSTAPQFYIKKYSDYFTKWSTKPINRDTYSRNKQDIDHIATKLYDTKDIVQHDANISRLMNIISNRNHNFSALTIEDLTCRALLDMYLYLSPELSVYHKSDVKKHDDDREPLTSNIISSSNTRMDTNIPLDTTKIENFRIVETTTNINIAETDTPSVSPDSYNGVGDVTPMIVIVDDNIGIQRRDGDEKFEVAEDPTISTKSVEDIMETNAIEAFDPNDSTATTLSIPAPGATVDHKSWENLVQAVPVMSVVLNKTQGSGRSKRYIKHTQKKRRCRSKRYINVIPIEIAQPQQLSSDLTFSKDNELVAYFSDVQQFSQLIELRDDEIQSREALRYLGQYVGPTLFNLCDVKEPKFRHVLLFNSSRIVIAINNFTLDRMMLVLTSAEHPDKAGMGRCPRGTLECQVVGKRVCIDDTSACDGVPNCGSNVDIYDEDRLDCGGAAGMQHSAIVAALSLLAALLAMLYAVYYWLKRCLSPVASAFFVYTDGTENILYLDSIMRSPTVDDNEINKPIYQGNLLDEEFNTYPKKRNIKSVICDFFSHCFAVLFCRRRVVDDKNEDDSFLPHHMYSFTELEIRNMIGKDVVNVAIQTGESLEMSYYRKIEDEKNNTTDFINFEQNQNADSSKAFGPALRTSESYQQIMNELDVIKFSRDARSQSIQSSSKRPIDSSRNRNQEITGLEEELHTTDLLDVPELPSGSVVNKTDLGSVKYSEKSEASSHARKRLRFDDHTIYIPDKRDESKEFALNQRRSVCVGTNSQRYGNQVLEMEENVHLGRGHGRDFKRFWGGIKPKKKTHS